MSSRAVVEVAPDVFVATSRAYVTTSTIVVRDGAAVLIDPAWDPDELVGLADLIDERGETLTAGVSTHAHHDHLLWHPRFGAVPRYASPETAWLAAEHRDELLAQLGPDWPAELRPDFGRLQAADEVPFAEPLELLVHNGHPPGHTAVWLPERRVLICGDMLSDEELPLPFGPDDLPAYLAGLDVLAPYVERAAVLVPGHGRPTDRPDERLAADRGYLAALAAGGDPDDPRRAHPHMAEVHARLRELSRGRESRSP